MPHIYVVKWLVLLHTIIANLDDFIWFEYVFGYVSVAALFDNKLSYHAELDVSIILIYGFVKFW